METTTKYWPDAKVPNDAEYVGSFNGTAGECDVYLIGDSVRFQWETYCTNPALSQVESDGNRLDYPNTTKALALIRAHRARTPAPSAPAAMSITRERLEEAANGCNVHPDHAAKLLFEFGITVAPPPPPQKSVNEQVAERMVKLIRDGMEVQFTHPAERGRIVLLRHINDANEHTVTLMREYITAALDARDAEHRQRLEPLLKLIDQPYRDTFSQYETYIREIREQVKKLAERSAAK